jgi:hypothetical protein
MFNEGLIDSLRVRVKMEHVTIIDKRIISEWVAYYPSLEALDNDEQYSYDEELRRAQPYTRIIQGITYRLYPKAFINSNKYAEEYMVFQISAKMLKHKYFEGITSENIANIIRDINGLGVIKITPKAFLDGLVSDIDICINQLIDAKALQTAFSLINRFPRESKKPLLHMFQQKQNIGIDFNKREKATNTNPYCKIYHKGHELETKSSEFYATFLQPMRKAVLDNLVRFEFTIKAHKHKQYLQEQGLNANFKTLNDLLKISNSDLKEIAQSGLKHYLEPRASSKVSKENKPMDIVLLYFMENLIKQGWGEGQILGFKQLMDCKVQRSVTGSKVKKLLQQLTEGENAINKKLQDNERAQSFLNNLGFYTP